MTRITRRVLALPVVVALAAIAIISLSVSPASAAVIAGDRHSYGNHFNTNQFSTNHHADDDKSASTTKELESYKPAVAQVERECPTKHRSAPPPVKTRTPVPPPTQPVPSVTPSTPHAADGGGNPLTSGHATPTRPIVTSRPHPAHTVTEPARSTPAPATAVATAAAPPETAATPSLITAPASESLALGDSPSTPPAPVTTSSAAAAGSSPAASSTPPAASRTINLASGSPALGLSDNLMLAALVAVFALAVIALVTAGGRRSGWRQH
jgi:hypothetical protein